MTSALDRLAPEILARISFFLAAPELATTVASPSLVALHLTSRALHAALQAYATPLRALLYRATFDTAAAAQRLPPLWCTPRCFAAELAARLPALRRVRRRANIRADEAELVRDLWTVFVLLLEDSGKNYALLTRVCGVRAWVRDIVCVVFGRGPHRPDLTLASLAVWVLWLTDDHDTILAEQEQDPQHLIQTLLYTLTIGGFQWSSYYAPTSPHSLPSCPHDVSPHLPTDGQPPPLLHTTYLNHPLSARVPPLTPAASAAYLARFESREVLDPAQFALPRTRADADALRRAGPTMEDVARLRRVRLQLPRRGPPDGIKSVDVEMMFDEERAAGDDDDDDEGEGEQEDASEQHDALWYRLVACVDPCAEESTPLRGVVHDLGSLGGCWHGRMVVPDPEAFTSYLFAPPAPRRHHHPRRPTLAQIRSSIHPLYVRLREYHCLAPDEPLTSCARLNLGGVSISADQPDDGDEAGVNGVLGAWMPPWWDVREDGEGATVWDPVTRRRTRYALHRGGHGANGQGEGEPYGAAVMRKVAAAKERWAAEAAVHECREDDVPMDDGPLGADVEAEWEDTVEHVSSGVRDILLLGETGAPHGAAWGDHVFVGRVRSWDGLVVLLRLPRPDPARTAFASPFGDGKPMAPHAAAFHAVPPHDHGHAHAGRWVFRGYMQGGNILGRWRDTATAVDVVGLEGAFCLSRDEVGW
ncbi:hypothetical protein PUNSTDRAFT_128535 [Punctularia strigosozonata HHB-11173 SS5]|uniref:F-box domain-containing protein n=1 Tax=Punctularia strigosozonata (strain HHB-11173) TaxID=741275 RepID=R7S290_PUNST|nr:uncharacterized protein PUNSTDRAFT_128535 [Punctularia strigosozonata HHB-11173 SS5]EIN03979.1 hypothetical protein PUNSTDRAFT_128535 [Punctularia strigosozonata HHB-11173 SS5]